MMNKDHFVNHFLLLFSRSLLYKKQFMWCNLLRANSYRLLATNVSFLLHNNYEKRSINVSQLGKKNHELWIAWLLPGCHIGRLLLFTKSKVDIFLTKLEREWIQTVYYFCSLSGFTIWTKIYFSITMNTFNIIGISCLSYHVNTF